VGKIFINLSLDGVFLTTGAKAAIGNYFLINFPCPKSSPNILPTTFRSVSPILPLNSFDIQNSPVIYFDWRKRIFY